MKGTRSLNGVFTAPQCKVSVTCNRSSKDKGKELIRVHVQSFKWTGSILTLPR